jgi:hypothetical protein
MDTAISPYLHAAADELVRRAHPQRDVHTRSPLRGLERAALERAALAALEPRPLALVEWRLLIWPLLPAAHDRRARGAAARKTLGLEAQGVVLVPIRKVPAVLSKPRRDHK